MDKKSWIVNLDTFIPLLIFLVISIHSCNGKGGNTKTGKVVGCKELVKPKNGGYKYDADKVFFHCDQGYELIGDGYLQCLDDGTWSAEVPSCKKPVVCGYPGNNLYCLTNITQSTSKPGTVASYECEQDLVLIGPKTRTCNEKGHWDPDELPICVVNVVQKYSPNPECSENIYDGYKIFDGNVQECSHAVYTNEMASHWTMDLLEIHQVYAVVLIFGDFTGIELDLQYATKPNEFKALKKIKDYKITEASKKTKLGESKTMMMTLLEPKEIRYLYIQVSLTQKESLQLCEVFVYSKSATPKELCIERQNQYLDVSENSVEVINRKCYAFQHEIQDTWTGSNDRCKLLHGSLATILSNETNEFLKQILFEMHPPTHRPQKKSYWIGGYRKKAEADVKTHHDDWMWVNGDSIKFYNWGRDHPNEEGSHPACIQLLNSFNWQWNDANCDIRDNFICEYGVLRCGWPDIKENTLVAGSPEMMMGSVIKYQCSADNVLEGKAERTCEKSGRWSGSAPKCNPKGSEEGFKGNTEKPTNKQEKTKGGFKAGAIVAIVLGSIAAVIILIIIVAVIIYKKKSTGGKSMKYSKKSESAEVLDVSTDRGGNYSSSSQAEEFTK